MSSRESWQGTPDTGRDGHLAAILPIDRAAIESLSWQLGSRVTAGEDSTRLLEIANRTTHCRLTVFRATDHTCIVRFRPPVGREKFFGVAADDVRAMIRRLSDRGGWQVRDGTVDAI